jgi:hypothetical protein
VKRQLFDIWEDANEPGLYSALFPFRVQLVNYVGGFPTREKAESFIEATKKWRAAKSVTK